MNEDPSAIHRRLVAECEKVTAFFEGLSPADWNQQVYTAGSQWRTRQVLAHFVSAERAYARTLREVLAGGDGLPRDFDIDAFNEAEVAVLADSKPPDLIAAFRQARDEVVGLVSALVPDDLGRRGYHPWFGDSTLGDMLKLVYRHNMIHLRDLRRALEAGSPVEHRAVEPPTRQSAARGQTRP